MSSISNLGTSEQGAKLPLPRVPLALETESTTKYSGSKNTFFKSKYRWEVSEIEFFKNLINTEPYKTNYQNKKSYDWADLAKKMTDQFPRQRNYTNSTVYNYYKSNFLHKEIESVDAEGQAKRSDHSMIDKDIKKFIEENYSSYLLPKNKIDRSRFLEAINNKFSNKPIDYKTLDSQVHIIKTSGFPSNIASATTQTNFAPTIDHDSNFTEIEEQKKSDLFKHVIETFCLYLNIDDETVDFKQVFIKLNELYPHTFSLLTVTEFWDANKDEILQGPTN